MTRANTGPTSRPCGRTAQLVAESDYYEHLVLYAHGGLNSIKASARRIAAMKDVFQQNRIYPFHFMYDTGLLEEIADVVLGRQAEVDERAGGFTDFTDKLIEKATRKAGRAIWREMKHGAHRPFEDDGAGSQTIAAFLDAFAGEKAIPKKIHVVGHSTGALLLASLLQAMGRLENAPRIQSCVLLAPACTHEIFNEVYRPLMKERDTGKFGLHRMSVFNLDADLELGDTVTPAYRKSLLYLVSNAFEETVGERILGMQKFRRRLGRLPDRPVFQLHVSDGRGDAGAKTASRTHGGFDNDALTMNGVLRAILRKAPARAFTGRDLTY